MPYVSVFASQKCRTGPWTHTDIPFCTALITHPLVHLCTLFQFAEKAFAISWRHASFLPSTPVATGDVVHLHAAVYHRTTNYKLTQNSGRAIRTAGLTHAVMYRYQVSELSLQPAFPRPSLGRGNGSLGALSGLTWPPPKCDVGRSQWVRGEYRLEGIRSTSVPSHPLCHYAS
jgi:hypothetical protein